MSDDREVTVQGMRNAADFIRQQTGVDLDWLRAAADEIDRLRAAKTAALKLADERAKEAVELRAKLASARKALEPFVKKFDTVEATYRKRGGKPESFPDTHPSFDVKAKELRIGVWRAAKSALTDESRQPDPAIKTAQGKQE